MWKKQNFYFEQPDVQFKNEIVLEVLDIQGNSRTFSTVQAINSLTLNELGVPLIKLNKFDNNADGKIDNFNLHLEFRSQPSDIRNIKLIGTFDYSLKDLLQIEMVGLMVIDIDTPNGASQVITTGELQLKENAPVLVDSVKRTIYNTNPLDEYKSFSLFDILQFYNARNGKFNLF